MSECGGAVSTRIGRAQEDDALLGVQEVELAEVLDVLAPDRALEGEVARLERLALREARRLIRDPPPWLSWRPPRWRAAPRRSARRSTAPRAPVGELGQRPGGGRRL